MSATALLELWPTPAELVRANLEAAARAEAEGDHRRAASHRTAAALLELPGGGRL